MAGCNGPGRAVGAAPAPAEHSPGTESPGKAPLWQWQPLARCSLSDTPRHCHTHSLRLVLVQVFNSKFPSPFDDKAPELIKSQLWESSMNDFEHFCKKKTKPKHINAFQGQHDKHSAKKKIEKITLYLLRNHFFLYRIWIRILMLCSNKNGSGITKWEKSNLQDRAHPQIAGTGHNGQSSTLSPFQVSDFCRNKIEDPMNCLLIKKIYNPIQGTSTLPL